MVKLVRIIMAAIPKPKRKAIESLMSESRKIHKEGKGVFSHLSKQDHKKKIEKTKKILKKA